MTKNYYNAVEITNNISVVIPWSNAKEVLCLCEFLEFKDTNICKYSIEYVELKKDKKYTQSTKHFFKNIKTKEQIYELVTNMLLENPSNTIITSSYNTITSSSKTFEDFFKVQENKNLIGFNCKLKRYKDSYKVTHINEPRCKTNPVIVTNDIFYFMKYLCLINLKIGMHETFLNNKFYSFYDIVRKSNDISKITSSYYTLDKLVRSSMLEIADEEAQKDESRYWNYYDLIKQNPDSKIIKADSRTVILLNKNMDINVHFSEYNSLLEFKPKYYRNTYILERILMNKNIDILSTFSDGVKVIYNKHEYLIPLEPGRIRIFYKVNNINDQLIYELTVESCNSQKFIGNKILKALKQHSKALNVKDISFYVNIIDENQKIIKINVQNLYDQNKNGRIYHRDTVKKAFDVYKLENIIPKNCKILGILGDKSFPVNKNKYTEIFNACSILTEKENILSKIKEKMSLRYPDICPRNLGDLIDWTKMSYLYSNRDDYPITSYDDFDNDKIINDIVYNIFLDINKESPNNKILLNNAPLIDEVIDDADTLRIFKNPTNTDKYNEEEKAYILKRLSLYMEHLKPDINIEILNYIDWTKLYNLYPRNSRLISGDTKSSSDDMFREDYTIESIMRCILTDIEHRLTYSILQDRLYYINNYIKNSESEVVKKFKKTIEDIASGNINPCIKSEFIFKVDENPVSDSVVKRFMNVVKKRSPIVKNETSPTPLVYLEEADQEEILETMRNDMLKDNTEKVKCYKVIEEKFLQANHLISIYIKENLKDFTVIQDTDDYYATKYSNDSDTMVICNDVDKETISICKICFGQRYELISLSYNFSLAGFIRAYENAHSIMNKIEEDPQIESVVKYSIYKYLSIDIYDYRIYDNDMTVKDIVHYGNYKINKFKEMKQYKTLLLDYLNQAGFESGIYTASEGECYVSFCIEDIHVILDRNSVLFHTGLGDDYVWEFKDSVNNINDYLNMYFKKASNTAHSEYTI